MVSEYRKMKKRHEQYVWYNDVDAQSFVRSSLTMHTKTNQQEDR